MPSKGKGNQNLELHSDLIHLDAEDTSGNHEIRRRAYEIYQERGSLPGRALDDWLLAESEFESAALFMRAATGEKQRP
jgi:hypothetical protein